MARYHINDCNSFVEAIQEKVRAAKVEIMTRYGELEFYNAEEQKKFKAYYEELLRGLDDYSKRVGDIKNSFAQS